MIQEPDGVGQRFCDFSVPQVIPEAMKLEIISQFPS